MVAQATQLNAKAGRLTAPLNSNVRAMTSSHTDIDVRLSAQRALCGAIPNSLRAVSVEVVGQTIQVRSIFDDGCTEDDKELLSVAGTEIIADFPDLLTIDEEFLVIAMPQSMQHLTHLVFLRYEP